MNSEREIVKKLFESKDYEDNIGSEELEEASFTANGSTYTSAFGHYSKDGEPISREDYFKAKNGGSVSSVGTSKKSISPRTEPVKSPSPDNSNYVSAKDSLSKLVNKYNAEKHDGGDNQELYNKIDKERSKLNKIKKDYLKNVDWDNVTFNGDINGMSQEALKKKFNGNTPVAKLSGKGSSMLSYNYLIHPDGTVVGKYDSANPKGNHDYVQLKDKERERVIKTFKERVASGKIIPW